MTTIRNTVSIFALAICALGVNAMVNAQQNDPPSARTTAPVNAAGRQIDNRDRDFDMGWLGLIGLAGLAGLMGRNRDDRRTATHVTSGTAVR